MAFQAISPKEIGENLIHLLDDRWALLTAGDRQEYNTMTVSWGGAGELWNREVCFVFVRPQRYTYLFIEKYDGFSLAFFPESEHSHLALCGSKSGREIDKAAQCGFTLAHEGDVPYFEQAELVIVCKKIYKQDIDPKCFLDPTIEKNYNGDYHRMYVGQIEKVLKK